ncbi:BamA/TamA family outer membrane protein [Flammeovirga sp. OC4]|uniref:BamA/TamA family outer membrane protein n=1 Tax=Flammeovirga sp. OC4 TaxID=1382345 RepID=UPI000693CB71|nr:BamA/TamA family outer membrane protein [Flammeovirga sp. OC4]
MKTKILSLLLTLNLFIFDRVQAFTSSDTTSNITIDESTKEKKKAKNEDETPQKGKVYAAPLPIVASNPTFGVLYGFAGSFNMFLGDPSNTRMSTSLGTLTYSTKNQLMFTYKSNIYTPEDKMIFLGDWRMFDTSQPTFGLGTGPADDKSLAGSYGEGFAPGQDPQLLEFKYFRFHETALFKVKKNFYAGVGYHMDYHYDIKDVYYEEHGYSSHKAYSDHYGINDEEYVLSGVSLNLMYDSRDNAANPYTGRYALLTYRINPEWMGSTKSSSSLWLEYRDYFALGKKKSGLQPNHMLAFWGYGNFVTSGVTPYMNLPALGWDQFGRSGRAYTQGRFRGENIVYTELEYRAHLFGTHKNPNLLGAVAFANATTASSAHADIDLFQNYNFGYGVGLRCMLNKKSRTNITLDYAWGDYGAKGLFLSLNETF